MKTDKRFIKEARTVLLVDDNKCLLEVCQEFLEAMGYRVLIAREWKEAIEVFRQNQNEIDLVILDIGMPTMDGGEAYDRLKEITPNVKVLLLTGFSIDGEATEILRRGCNGLIQKPFRMNELAEKIRGILV
ncbi:MAG: response regulator [Deltaproteobacteria bacterium]|nr:response regulator [Deltaproteobacteria bacterium]MBW1796190.1 response regulator [Deltaproteobacteria bacterium]MBW2331774.1 response regulator [Deltaproteobacteria bacterium]